MIPETVFQEIYNMLPAGRWLRIAQIAAMLRIPPHKAATRMIVLKKMGLAENRKAWNGRSGETGEWRKLRRKHR
jgi:Mn-dependent DtxR family transcriptional regulator